MDEAIRQAAEDARELNRAYLSLIVWRTEVELGIIEIPAAVERTLRRK